MYIEQCFISEMMLAYMCLHLKHVTFHLYIVTAHFMVVCAPPLMLKLLFIPVQVY